MKLMNIDKDFLIPFIGLKNGEHEFNYIIEKEFFDFYDYSDFNTICTNVSILLNKKSTLLELHFKHKGLVNLPCDVTNEDFNLDIKGEIDLVVKFGEEFNDEYDDVLIIPFNEYQINVAQYIYEMITLSIPVKRVHPGIADGTLESEALFILGYQEDESSEQEEDKTEITEEEIDPRWSKLKKLLTDK